MTKPRPGAKPRGWTMTPELQRRAVAARKRNAAERRANKAATFVAPASKVCKDCGKEKPLEQFGKHMKMRDGHLNSCKACRYEYESSWKSANSVDNPPRIIKIPMTTAQIRRRSYEKHKVKRLAARKEHRLRNIEREKAREKRWQRNNRTVAYAKNARRRAAETQAVPKWLNAVQKAQIQEFYDIAAARTMQTGVKHHVDHDVPLRNKDVCGLHVPWNLQVLTEAENCSKHNKFEAGA